MNDAQRQRPRATCRHLRTCTRVPRPTPFRAAHESVVIDHQCKDKDGNGDLVVEAETAVENLRERDGDNDRQTTRAVPIPEAQDDLTSYARRAAGHLSLDLRDRSAHDSPAQVPQTNTSPTSSTTATRIHITRNENHSTSAK